MAGAGLPVTHRLLQRPPYNALTLIQGAGWPARRAGRRRRMTSTGAWQVLLLGFLVCPIWCLGWRWIRSGSPMDKVDYSHSMPNGPNPMSGPARIGSVRSDLTGLRPGDRH